jgi:hypothetical protein
MNLVNCQKPNQKLNGGAVDLPRQHGVLVFSAYWVHGKVNQHIDWQ